MEEPSEERTFTSDYEISESLSASLQGAANRPQLLGTQIGERPQNIGGATRGIKVYRGVRETIRELPN